MINKTELGRGTTLQAARSRDQFPRGHWDLSMT